ncbi:MAG: hypothetical protein K0Q55_2756, partial [Verrucomicrobia bacterium]|nr:hypothetical protein [Verrucomicrobiota bacterium]
WMLSTPIVLVLLLSAFSLARMKEDFLFSLLVIVVIFANYLLQPSMRVDVDGNRLIWEGDWIVFKNTATFQKSEIVDVIVTDFRSRRINSSTVDGYHIRLLLYSGKKVTIARNLPDKPHALWLADLIKSSLGLLSCAEIQR